MYLPNFRGIYAYFSVFQTFFEVPISSTVNSIDSTAQGLRNLIVKPFIRGYF